METEMHHPLVERGIATLFKELGPVETIEFFQRLGVRKGDSVKVMRGQFKNKTGKVDEASVKKTQVYVSGIEFVKRDGTKSRYPLQPSNLMLTELNMDDKLRGKIAMRK